MRFVSGASFRALAAIFNANAVERLTRRPLRALVTVLSVIMPSASSTTCRADSPSRRFKVLSMVLMS